MHVRAEEYSSYGVVVWVELTYSTVPRRPHSSVEKQEESRVEYTIPYHSR